MKYYELELKEYKYEGNNAEEIGTKTYYMRLTSNNAIALETKTSRSILELLGDVSVTNIVRFLEYMNKDNNHAFGNKEASSLYDELVDNGYTLEKIMTDVIYKVLVHSGFLTKEELEETIDNKEKVKAKAIKQLLEN